MFMQPIHAATEIAAKPRPLALKLAAGVLFLLAAVLLMTIWLAACALWFATAALVRAGAALPGLTWRTTLWAGELVVGR